MAAETTWAPPEVSTEPAPWSPPESSPAPAPDQAATFDRVYNGSLDSIDSRLLPHERPAVAALAQNTNNDEESRAQAFNQAYVKWEAPGLGENLQQNWPAVKSAYAKSRLGIDKADISDKELYGAISDRLSVPEPDVLQPGKWSGVARYKWYQLTNSISWHKAFDPVVNLPSAPQMRDIPEAGIDNPALQAGIYNSIFKPIAEGFLSPVGIATLGIGGELNAAAKVGSPLARRALVVMSGIFAGVMGKNALDQLPNMKAVLDNPDATTQQKTEAVGAPVGSALMALVAGLGTAFEVAPDANALLAKLRGATPDQAAVALRAEAAKTPVAAPALNAAAAQLDEISEPALDAKKKEAEAAAKPEATVAEGTPLPPNSRITIMEMGGKRATQIDIPGEGDRPAFSGSPEQAKAAGYTVPETAGMEPGQHITTAPEPVDATPSHAEITPLENGTFVVTDSRGALVDYATTHEEAERIAARADKIGPPLPPEPVSPFSESEPAGPVAPDPHGPVGVKNASMDAQRIGTGLEAPDHGETLKWEEARMNAAGVISRDPMAGRNLVDELAAKPRPVDGNEIAILLHEVNRTRLERNAADEALNEATRTGDEGARAAARIRVAMATEAFRKTDEALAKTGKLQGQALNARRMMMNEDYSLAALERRHIAANGGEPLDAKQQELVQKLAKDYADLEKKTAAHRELMEQRLAMSEADNAILRIINSARKTRKAPPKPARVMEYISARAGEARARIIARAKEGRVQAGLDPADVADHILVGAEYIAKGVVKAADWSAAMVKEFGEHLNENYLKVIYQKAKDSAAMMAKEAGPERDTVAERKDTVAMMKEKLAGGAKLSSLSHYVQKLAEQFVRDGITEREPLIDAVHGALKKVDPAITRRQAMDAISGYGDFRPLDADKAKAQLRDLKGQMQQLSKLEDMQKGSAPAKTGGERRTPSAEERRLQKMVNEAKRKGGFKVTDAATQLKTAIEAIKTRLKNEIDDLDHQISTGVKIVKGKTETPYDAESTALRERRDALKAQYDEMFPKKELTDEQRLSVAEKSADRQIAELERQIKTGEIFPEGKGEPLKLSSAELEAKRAKIAALKEEREYARGLIQPGEKLSPEESANRAFRVRTRNRIAALEDRIARDDYGPKPPRTAPPLDAESKALMAQKETIRKKDALAQLKYEEKNRTPAEKVLGAFVKWVRVGALSWPTVFGKLAGAAAWRMAMTPIEQVVGFGLSKIQPELAAKAPRRGVPELSGALKAEAKAHTEGIMLGIKGAGQLLRNKDTELSLMLSEAHLPAEWYDYFGKLHAALKEPTKMIEFSRSLESRTQHALRNGIDPTDPIEQMRLVDSAYKDANAAVFMQDNALVDLYKRAIASLEEKQKATGKPNLGLQVLSAAIQGEMPIVKVPTNIVAEIGEHMTGLLTGTAKSIFAHYNGLEGLSGEEADMILRLQTKGLIGTSLLLLGFFKAGQVGGFFQHGEKRKETDVQVGDVKVGDTTIDKAFLHSPQMGVVDFGATVRRVADSRFKKTDDQPKGLGMGLYAASVGLLDSVPFVRETSTVAKMLDEREVSSVAESKLTSLMIPGIVQWTAAQLDKKTPFSPFEDSVARKPTNIKEAFEKAIPGLRQEVPKNK